MVVNYGFCIYCDTKINAFNEEQFIEVVSDFTTMEKDIVVKNVLWNIINLKEN